MRKLLLIAAAAVLVAGCTAPPSVPQNPEAVYRQASAPASSVPAVTPVEGGWMIRQVHPAGYLWREDGEALAFLDVNGLSSISADGRKVEPVAAGDKVPVMVKYAADGLFYLEMGPVAITLMRWRPDTGASAIAQLSPSGVSDRLWWTLTGDRLLYALPGKTVHIVDLKTGASKDLGGEPVDVMNGEFALSADGRYLTYKLANRGDAVRVIDVQTGAARPVPGEAHLTGTAWSPVEALWAARAAETGSGLPRPVGANLEEGATHVDVGTAAGDVRHLRPPLAVNLTAGPWWSPDGQRLAVMAEPPADGQPGPIWIADVGSGKWTKLQPSEPFWVTGWSPDGRRLTTHGAGLLLPADGGPLVRTDGLKEQVVLPDGSTVDLYADGKVTHRGAQLLAPAPEYRERLTVAGRHAALFVTRGGDPTDLIVLHLQ